MRFWFLLRWAARDLRRRWLQVAAIGLVIAIGTGVFAALSGAAAWRRESNDASFELTGMYDLRVRAGEGVTVERGALLALLDGLPDPAVVTIAEERLVVATQVDASTADATILVPGRIVGLDVSRGGPHLTIPWLRAGRALTPGDTGAALLEYNFADFHDLPSGISLDVAGGSSVDIVGIGLAPEYFLVTTEEGGFYAEANFATLFTTLDTAGRLSGTPGKVNDLVLQLRDGTDVAAVASELGDIANRSALDLGATVMTAHDDDTYRILYDDIEGDQRVEQVFALIVLAGAAFGAFNLSTRMVESQRRELGISMALGASRRQLAARPMIVGLEISVLGAISGIGMGLLVMQAIRPVYLEVLPLPVWHTSFQWGSFAQAAALGFVLPLAATAWPVLRAVHMTPIDAISTVNHSARHGLAPLLRRMPWPRSAFRRMPFGNVLRTPRRTLLTALGIGAAISTLVAVLGLLDSFTSTMLVNEREVIGNHIDRMQVSLDTVHSLDDPVFTSLVDDPAVTAVEPVLRTGGVLEHDGTSFQVMLEAIDLDSTVWTPTIVAGDAATPGLILSRVAAHDLGLKVGDTVNFTHPTVTDSGYVMTTSEVTVAALHPSPYRAFTYVDRSLLPLFGAEGLANQAYVLPANGDVAAAQRALFHLPGVTSVQAVGIASKVLRDSLDDFTGLFRVLESFILLLTLLITYNATSINADERARERATLFAFGLPVRRVVVLEVVEGLLYGLLGTAVGLLVGRAVMVWVIRSVIASTLPELEMTITLSGGSILTACVMGVIAVAVAPLLTVRRLVRMDVPGTLRVVE